MSSRSADVLALDPVPADVRSAQAGDERAFERLYRTHIGRIFALALRLVGEAARAEELAQDVFVRAWERLGSFRGESAIGTWLHRLAVNVILTDRRSGIRFAKRIEFDDEIEARPVAARDHSPVDVVDLERAIAGLPPGARAVFVLHDVEGYQHKEIAALVGIAEGTSKAHLFRARRLLMEVLER